MSTRTEAAKPTDHPQPFLYVDITQIEANPRNPKSRATVDPELVESIRALGLLQPIVLRRPDPASSTGFEIVAGHRRFAAIKALGWQHAPALVIDGGEDDGALGLLAENNVRKNFSPIEEADFVAGLLETMTREQVAAAVGKSTGWVARRANLRTLSKKVRSEVAGSGELSRWPSTWLQELAVLAPHAQDDFLESVIDRGWPAIQSIDDLRDSVARRIRPIAAAPWDVADEKLVGAVGSCAACPKNTANAPELVDGAPVCRDDRCWAAKLKAHLHRSVKQAEKEYGPGLKAVAAKSDPVEESVVAEVGRKVLHDWKSAPKKTGVPALLVSGSKAGQVVFIEKPIAQPGSRSDDPKEREKAKAVAREEKVRRAVLEELAGAIEGCAWDDVHPHVDLGDATELEVLAQVWARADAEYLTAGGPYGQGVARPKNRGGWASGEALAVAIWEDLRSDVALRISSQSSGAPNPSVDGVTWLARFVGFDLEDAVVRATEAVAPRASAAAKRAGKKGGAK